MGGSSWAAHQCGATRKQKLQWCQGAVWAEVACKGGAERAAGSKPASRERPKRLSGGELSGMAVLASGARLCNFSAAAARELSHYQESFLWPILVAEFLLAVAGNGLALSRFCTRESRPWNPAVVFSTQLAISNLLYALTLLPQAAYLYPPKRWRYGAVACRLERFLFACNLLGGTVFLTLISLNRYLGVVHPFFARSHLQPKHAWALSAAGWVLAALLAAPTLGFSGLKVTVAAGKCSATRPEACAECQGTADTRQLGAYRAYGLALAGLGGALPLLLTLAAYGALGQAVLRSPSLRAAEKLHVAVLVASGVALYAVSYVPYHVMHVLNVNARQRWLARCPNFRSEAQAVQALELAPYLGYQVMRAVVPLAICIHPLLYMAVVPSLGCCTEHRGPEDRGHGQQDLPLTTECTPEVLAPMSLEANPSPSLSPATGTRM